MNKVLMYGIVFLICIASALGAYSKDPTDYVLYETFDGSFGNFTNDNCILNTSIGFDDSASVSCPNTKSFYKAVSLNDNTIKFHYYVPDVPIGTNRQMIFDMNNGLASYKRLLIQNGVGDNTAPTLWNGAGYAKKADMIVGWNNISATFNSTGATWCYNDNCTLEDASTTSATYIKFSVDGAGYVIFNIDEVRVWNGSTSDEPQEVIAPSASNHSVNVTLHDPINGRRTNNYTGGFDYVFSTQSDSEPLFCTLYTNETGTFANQSQLTNDADGLVAYWTFDDDTKDNWKNYSITNYGATKTLEGKIDGAYNLTTNDYMKILNPIELDNFTFSAWILPTSSTFGAIISDFNQAGLTTRFSFERRTDRRLNLLIYDSGVSKLDMTSNAYLSNNEWIHVSFTKNGLNFSIYINGTLDKSQTATGFPSSGYGNLTLGKQGEYNDGYFNGIFDEVMFWNRSLTGSEVASLYSDSRYFTPVLNHINLSVNNTENNVSADGDFIWNVVCQDESGNSSFAAANFTLQVDVDSPYMSYATNNFFSTDNSTIISEIDAASAILNITLTDNIDLYAYELLIRNSAGTLVFNDTNLSLDGTSEIISKNININFTEGRYFVNLTATDSHTAKKIEDYKVDKYADRLVFDDVISITAVDAVGSDAVKAIDRYSFEFEYDTPKKDLTFVIASNSPLSYRQGSKYSAHFVDWVNRRWIDFEGGFNEDKVKVKYLSDYSYEVTIKDAYVDKVKFKSIGGLNSWSEEYTYYKVDNPLYAWSVPTQTLNILFNDSITLKANITGNYLNTTRFGLFNSSGELVEVAEVSAQVNGTYIYNHTFTGLTDSVYTIVANHTTDADEAYVLDGLTYNDFYFDNCSLTGNVTLTLQVYDEDSPTAYINENEVEVEINYWYIDSDILFNYTTKFDGNQSYDICLYPSSDLGINANVYVKYTSTYGFTHRHYMINQSFTNTTLVRTIYNTNTTTTYSDLKITARNKFTYDYLTGVVATLQRNYPSEGTWRNVQMDKSGDLGLIFFNVIEETTDYRLIFKDLSNNVLKTTDSLKFVCSSGLCDVTFVLSPFSGDSTGTNITYYYQYNNNTQDFLFIFNDLTGLTSSLRIEAMKYDRANTVTLCNVTVYGSAGTANCSMTGYTGEAFIRVYSSASPEQPLFTYIQKLTGTKLNLFISPNEGAFWTFGVMVTTIGFGIVISPVVAIITSILGLILIAFLGLFNPINITLVVLACVMGIAISLKVRT